jgi:membrane protease YdiL (CAAX protease family)
MFFPNELPGALMARAMLAACGVALLLFGSKMLLRRDGLPADALGLRLTTQHAKGFVLGVAGGLLFIALLAATLAVQVPLHWERGSLSLSYAALAAHTYFWTSFGEELIFRGYALIALSRYVGPRKAVWALALPFGLFHLPGMGMGMAAAKMIATTSAMSLVFSYSFLFTGTLWTAVGLHAAADVSLHTLTGLDGEGRPTVWKPIFGLWPTGYDAGFWTLITIAGLVAFFLSRKINTRLTKSSKRPGSG